MKNEIYVATDHNGRTFRPEMVFTRVEDAREWIEDPRNSSGRVYIMRQVKESGKYVRWAEYEIQM